MTIASANKLEDKEWNESPQGAFVLLGGFDASGFVLAVMLLCLVLFGLAFTIAAITQIQNFATRKWHFEINWKKIRHPAERWFVLVTGHVGFFGRACSFAFVAVLMFKALAKDTPSQDPDTPQQNNLIANGLNQLIDTNTTGVAAMMVIGSCLLLYGVFATSMAYYRRFPTPPPSGQPRYLPR
ncbi:hypothetical protein HDU87_007179 [Geranomyces variabilis]|uniref:Uncharacterized protein n=1 Tax=Geranomyces variabilis TaxID=109894 RepID=A0AAD5TJV0_9FUNG|nr:hypothetical protein HDU87_007179 [Geranomyces variabilis]